MDEPYTSDPEDILDQHELEIALYSQVHFDPGPGTESWNEKTENILSLSDRRPFHIEVKSLAAKISSVKACQPMPTGDFIAFTEKPCKKAKEGLIIKNVDSVASCSYTKPSLQAQRSQKKLKSSLDSPVFFEIDKRGTTKSCTVESEAKINKNEKVSKNIANKKSSPVSNNKMNTNSNAQSDMINSTNAKSVTTKDDAVKKVKPVVSAETIEESSKDKEVSTSSFSVADKFLPFKMTKTNLARSEEKTLKPDSSTEHLDKTVEKTSKKNKIFPKLDDFLHLTKSDNNMAAGKGKKKVTKLDAAVQIRKPTVCVRRPPVVVKYKQDSDTATDYSDSECSNLASPVKAFTKTTAGKKEMSSNRDDSNKSLQPNLNTAEPEKDEDSAEESGECILVEDDASSDDAKAEEVLEESSSSQVSTDDESESGEIVTSSTSSEEDGPLDVTPNLEFNIEGGISALLSASPSPAEGDWKIDQRDRFKNKSISSRYFSPLKVQCRNCRVEGHLSRDCPKPLKKKCVYCAHEGHVCYACPNAVCFNCDTPGHRNTECPGPKRNWYVTCRRCRVYGHDEKLCPDRWRQYHISTDPNHINTQSKTATNDRVYCYNCASEGHFGHDCKAARMNKFIPASFPLIAHYDSSKTKRRWSGKEKRERHGGKKSAHNLKRKHSGTEVDEVSPKKRKRSHKKIKEKDKGKSKAQPRDVQQTEKPQSGSQSSQSSAKRHRNQPKPNFENSRKRHFDFEALEDFANHQVHDNEWWNSQPAEKRTKRGNQRVEYPDDNDWQGGRMRESDRRNNSRGPQTDYSQNPLWEREYRQMGQPSPRQMGQPSPRQMGQPSPRQMGQPSPRQMGQPSPRQGQYMMGRNVQHIRPLLPEPRTFLRLGNGPSPRGMNHSQSWPNMARPKNRGGFGFQNKEFAVMKNNCDRSRYQANW